MVGLTGRETNISAEICSRNTAQKHTHTHTHTHTYSGGSRAEKQTLGQKHTAETYNRNTHKYTQTHTHTHTHTGRGGSQAEKQTLGQKHTAETHTHRGGSQA